MIFELRGQNAHSGLALGVLLVLLVLLAALLRLFVLSELVDLSLELEHLLDVGVLSGDGLID